MTSNKIDGASMHNVVFFRGSPLSIETNVYIHDLSVKEERLVRQQVMMSGAKQALSVRFVDDMHKARFWILSDGSAMAHYASKADVNGKPPHVWVKKDDGLYEDGVMGLQTLTSRQIANRLDGIVDQPKGKASGKDTSSSNDSLRQIAEQIRAGMESGTGSLTIANDDLMFAFNFGDKSVKCSSPAHAMINASGWSDIDFRHFDITSQGSELLPHTQPASMVIWKLCKYNGDDGIFMSPLFDQTALKLTRWPDFDRLPHEYDDYRMASLIQRRSLNSGNLMKLLKIGDAAVKSFFNGVYLCNYADIDASATPVVLKNPDAPRTGLFGLWKKVRTGWGS